jgi:predicted transcriptional regulator
MPTLVELTAQIVTSHAAGTSMTSEDLLKELQNVYATLKGLEAGEAVPVVESAPTEAPAITIKQAFKNKDEVLCMICGKGFKALKRHLTVAHGLKPGAYRKQFGIPSKQPLVAKSYSEKWRQAANDRGQGEILARARAVRAANIAVVPAAKVKAPVPSVKVIAPVPTMKKKAVVPAKVNETRAPAKTKKIATR